MQLRIATLAWLLAALPAYAQHWSFQTYGPDVGLANPTILGLHQDREGYLWASTESGIFRYDGDRFRPFPVKSGAKNGQTYSMHSSLDGQLWVGSSAGLFRFSGDRFVAVAGFEHERLESGQVIASDADNLYVATPGGLRSMPLASRGQIQLVSPKSASSVFVASDKTVWFGCGTALCSLRDGREQEWAGEPSRYAPGHYAPGHYAPNGPWQSMVEDTAGRLWIRSNDAVAVRDPGGSGFHPVGGLSRVDSSRGALLATTRGGQVLIPNYAGLTICEGAACRNYGSESGLQRSEVLTAMEDREGSVWIGYSGHGLVRWLGREQWQSFAEAEGLDNPGIWRIVRDASGRLWVGTSRGLYEGIESGGRLRFHQSGAVGDLAVHGLAADPGGSLWIGTFQPGLKGLVRFDPRSGRKEVYPLSQPLPRFAIDELDRDSDGTVWVAGPRGVMRWKPGAHQLEPVPLPVDGFAVSAVRSTPQGLFVSGRNGLYIQQGRVRRLLTVADGLKDNFVQSLTIGPDGAVWLSYFSPSGISRLEVKGDQVELRHYTTDDGLPSNVIYSQFFDARGRHWLGTDNGVAELDGERWIHYDVSDGLVWNDCNSHAYLAEPDGTVWFGTSGGLARFHPADLPRPVLPKALITSVLRNDVPAQSMDFDSATYSVALRFSMLSYRRQTPRFRYRVGSAASPWAYSQTREVRFAELPPGSYRFEVQGEVGLATWSSSAPLQFRIRPAWYRSWPAEVGWALMLGGLVWLAGRQFRQRAIREELEAAVSERTRDLAAATARAEQANRFKGEFLANMSHEMRTPLNGVIGVTQLALDASEQPEVVQHLKIVQLSASGLLSLINDVLDFSKIESGLMEIVPAPFALRPFVADLCLMMHREASLKGLVVTSAVDESAPVWVLADDARLRQVLLNLVANAVKFTARGGITISVGCAAGQLLFAVADTGIGISGDKKEVIFDAFRQADSSTSRRYGGSGLGLTISQKLVQLMGGRISLESEPGQGSTFSFAIPAPAVATPSERRPKAQESPAESMKILVAEDHKVNQYLITNLLRKLGHVPTIVENGVEALAALNRATFDMVLMDIQMPEMDGLETARRIRLAEVESGTHIAIVALTARAMAGDREEILAAGMDEYLEKPIRVERLKAVLKLVAGKIEAQSCTSI
jgi:signal transduction histidine kinase/streptogramin lyase/ActR/RegA family two-component response regulator